MFTYVLKRVLTMIPTLIGITLITFFIITCAPGDPVAMQMGGEAGGGSAGAEGGGGAGAEAQARRADAIKAKKKLLGMMEPERSLRVWTLPAPDAGGPATGAAPLERRPNAGAFDAWTRSLVVAADGRTLWTGLTDGSLRKLAVPSGDEDPAFRAESFVITAADGKKEGSAIWKLARSADGGRLAASDGTGRIRVIDATTGRTLAEAEPLGRTVRDVAFLPDGSKLLSACDDGRLRLHDAATLKVEREYSGHSLYVGALAVSPDGATAYSVGYDRKVRAWDVATARATTLGEIGASGNAMALSDDGSRLAVGGDDRGARVYRLEQGGRSATVQLRLDGVHPRPVTVVAFARAGELLVTASRDGAVRVWRMSDGLPVAASPDSTNGEVFAAVPSRDGTTLWTASESDRTTPIWKRYFTWLGKTARFDFDRSFVDNEPVIDKIREALPVTMGINVLAILITYLIAVPLGVAMARRRGGAFDQTASVVVFLLWSMPNFWFATLLIQWLSSKAHFDAFPSVGLYSVDHASLAYLPWLRDRAAHLVLPLAVMTYAGFAGLSQYMRSSMLETLSQDFVRTARAKGANETIVVYKHALRNSLVTMVTLIGTMLPALIGGSVIVERIFSINGMGYMGFEAILTRDYPVVMAITTMSAFLTLVGMLVSDILYAVVDPRISHK